MLVPRSGLTITPRFDDGAHGYRAAAVGVDIVRSARKRAAEVKQVGFAPATRGVWLRGALVLLPLTAAVWLLAGGWAALPGAAAFFWCLTWITMEVFDRNTFAEGVPAVDVPEVRVRIDAERVERHDPEVAGGGWVEIARTGALRGVTRRNPAPGRCTVELELEPAPLTLLDDLTEEESMRVEAAVRAQIQAGRSDCG